MNAKMAVIDLCQNTARYTSLFFIRILSSKNHASIRTPLFEFSILVIKLVGIYLPIIFGTNFVPLA